MKIINTKLRFSTKGPGDLIDITEGITAELKSTELVVGNVTVFVVGSTAGITTFEYEPGLIQDVGELFERLVPSSRRHHHDDTWGDANGFSHLRAMITSQSFTMPFDEGRLLLGTWQQVVLAEFDNRPRNREVIVQITGE